MATHGRTVVTASALKSLVRRVPWDPAAFGSIYDLLADRVYAFAYRQLGSCAETAEPTAATAAPGPEDAALAAESAAWLRQSSVMTCGDGWWLLTQAWSLAVPTWIGGGHGR